MERTVVAREISDENPLGIGKRPTLAHRVAEQLKQPCKRLVIEIQDLKTLEEQSEPQVVIRLVEVRAKIEACIAQYLCDQSGSAAADTAYGDGTLLHARLGHAARSAFFVS